LNALGGERIPLSDSRPSGQSPSPSGANSYGEELSDKEVAVQARLTLRKKLVIGCVLLGLVIAVLGGTTMVGGYNYRGVARGISARSAELPLAIDLSLAVTELRHTLSQAKRKNQLYYPDAGGFDVQLIREEFRDKILVVEQAVRGYRDQLDQTDNAAIELGDDSKERETILRIERSLVNIQQLNRSEDWVLQQVKVEQLAEELDHLHQLAGKLPTFLIHEMKELKTEVQAQYRSWILVSAFVLMLTVVFMAMLFYLTWLWLFRPLRILMNGSRLVAGGDFKHRIQLSGDDELATLADAMNAMTARFEEIRQNLDRQVQQRTQQVVRSEQLASVGFLAAGVAHEINNPLASIAFCAESLRDRFNETVVDEESDEAQCHVSDVTVLRTYLSMIEEEAFRCKEITERLLDFSRLGDVEKQSTDISELVQGVIDMVGHLGKYREKTIQFSQTDVAIAAVNPAEIKQVVLNLITNALDSIDPGQKVHVEVLGERDLVRVVVRDEGCGMTEETRQHLFEPFFTRRRDGQGTGLGLSISYRIVSDHGGQIDAYSEGAGLGSEFSITLPCGKASRSYEKRERAA